MRDHGRHCPFLNRSHPACSAHLTLERLRHAFEYCLDNYQACPIFNELLTERRLLRRQTRRQVGTTHAPTPFIQVKVLRRNPKPLAASA